MKNSQNSHVVSLLLVIIILLLAGGGVYVYQNKKAEGPVDIMQTLLTSPASTPDTTTQIKVDNKKTVESSKTPVIPVASTVRVISPNGGETLVTGKSYTVKWWDDSDAGNKTIFAINSVSTKTLLPISGSSFMRSSGIDGTYAYTWKVGTNMTAGSYKLMICKANTNNCDTSDNYFLIASPTATGVKPSITILYPNGGESLDNGGTDSITTIRWTSSDFGNSLVTIGLQDKKGSWIKTIASNISNTGSYDWKIDPTIISNEYRIAITSSLPVFDGDVVSDSSDNLFVVETNTIMSGKTAVKLLSPNGGENLTMGSKVSIKWASLGVKPTSGTIGLIVNYRCPFGYSCNMGPNTYKEIATITGSELEKGEYEWIVDKSGVDGYGNEFLIQMRLLKDDLGNISFDDSDSGFTIK